MAEALVQTFLGNVGIGTDDPGAYKLDIVGGNTSVESIKADSLQVDGVTNAFIPYGIILAWSGSIASIPTGWSICNGSNGTPDLRDYFVIGGGSTYTPPNATGGSTSVTLTSSNIPSHTHSFNTNIESANHSHSVTDPAHGHGSYATDNWGTRENTTSQAPNSYAQAGFNTNSANTSLGMYGNNSNHYHNFSVANSGLATPDAINTIPPYYALAYIMKT